MMQVPKIKVDQLNMGTLMQGILHGDIRIPRFQREFIWSKKRVNDLLDKAA